MAPLLFSYEIFVVFLVLLVSMYFLKKTLCRREKSIYSFNDKPAFKILLVKGAFHIFRKQGYQYAHGDHSSSANGRPTPTNPSDIAGVVYLPGHHLNQVTITDFRIDKNALQAYKKICCPNTADQIPPCYLESLFLRLLAVLATSSTCLVNPLGLIHTKQTITQHQALDHLMDGRFDLQARLVYYKKVERGVELLVELKAVDQHDICVWEGSLTLLSRSPKAQKSGAAKNMERRSDAENTQKEDPSMLGKIPLHVPRDMGILYARATGDWNPHHLYPWTAKLLGYRAPIAHGMWMLARTLHEVLHGDTVQNRYPIHVDCAFKRPMFMPGEAHIQYGRDRHAGDKSSFWFKCSEQTTGVPHVVGTVQLGSQ